MNQTDILTLHLPTLPNPNSGILALDFNISYFQKVLNYDFCHKSFNYSSDLMFVPGIALGFDLSFSVTIQYLSLNFLINQ